MRKKNGKIFVKITLEDYIKPSDAYRISSFCNRKGINPILYPKGRRFKKPLGAGRKETIREGFDCYDMRAIENLGRKGYYSEGKQYTLVIDGDDLTAEGYARNLYGIIPTKD